MDELKATLANQIKQSTNKIESLNEQNIRLERELVVAQKELEILHFDKERLSKELEEKEEKWIVTERDLTKQLVSMKHEYEEKLRVLDSNHEKRKDTEMELLRADMEAHFITQLSDRETEMNDDITRYKELNDQLNREIAILKNEKIHYQGLYEEEKTESGALRLRIQLLSNQQNSSYPPPPLPAADPQKQTIKQARIDF